MIVININNKLYPILCSLINYLNVHKMAVYFTSKYKIRGIKSYKFGLFAKQFSMRQIILMSAAKTECGAPIKVFPSLRVEGDET